MKKLIPALVLSLLILLSSCTVVIPGSVEAQAKFERAGYEVERVVLSGVDAEEQGLTQMVQLNVYSGEKIMFQVYYFCSEEEADHFYEQHKETLASHQETVKKNRYSIYRGTIEAREIFLKED